jgi:hypothetical protein|tara:strand:+ start:352 stop:627 length:276 start_codon:yes stop_codon:yes gene_type:complete
MSEYDTVVERQRILLEAEAWAIQPKAIHVHSLDSMWYETEESQKDLENGSVTDTEYNGGHIIRKQKGKIIRTFGKTLIGEDLAQAYQRGGV